jgi:glycosyltransferase involved in cell wall biosynthesis
MHARRIGYGRYLAVRGAYLAVDIVLFVPLLIVTALSRLAERPIDVGLGPLPSINSRGHKKCLERYGYRAETFVYHTRYLTSDFDVSFQKYLPRALGPYAAYAFCLFRYKCLYTYFTGGPLGFTTLLARCEPYLLRLAGIRTVIMPFGADVHELTRTKSLLMVDAYSKDYPGFRHDRARTASLIDVWTHGADHIISGCDWVDFMYYWDTLMLSHLAVDTDALDAAPAALHQPEGPLLFLHAPNHRNLKGTGQIVKAVDALRARGLAIELSIVESVPNSQMPDLIRAADVVIDQLVVGWYAMFALEAMALGKPVICYVRPDLRDLYVGADLIEPGELPLIEASAGSIEDILMQVASMPRPALRALGLRSRAFVEKHHSIEAVGRVFDRINRQLGLTGRTS